MSRFPATKPATDHITGSTYLERGQVVLVLARWRNSPGPGPDGSTVLRAPRNVRILRMNGTTVVRPFRGLRRLPLCPQRAEAQVARLGELEPKVLDGTRTKAELEEFRALRNAHDAWFLTRHGDQLQAIAEGRIPG